MAIDKKLATIKIFMVKSSNALIKSVRNPGGWTTSFLFVPKYHSLAWMSSSVAEIPWRISDLRPRIGWKIPFRRNSVG
jgi:hypothetical protein